MKKILFVCHGNICRSPMAEYVMKDLVKKSGLEEEFQIASAATSRLKKFRELERILVLADGTEIPMEDVVALESGIFQTLI